MTWIAQYFIENRTLFTNLPQLLCLDSRYNECNGEINKETQLCNEENDDYLYNISGYVLRSGVGIPIEA